MSSTCLVLDIGGTKCAAAAFYDGVLGPVSQMETLAHQGAEDVLSRIVVLLRRVAAEAAMAVPEAIGVVCPGRLSRQDSVVIKAPMLGWYDQPLGASLSQEFGCRVLMENDANAAAYGEYRYGAGKGCDSVAYITVSTGVGCGLVVHDRIWHGAHDCAAELGHLHLFDGGRPCRCGGSGCLQTVASGTSIAEIARERLGEDGLTAWEVARRARAGDEVCLSIYRQAGDALGRGIAALQAIADLQRVILGGSVSKDLDLMEDAILHRIRQNGYETSFAESLLSTAALAPHSGLWGIAGLMTK